jgi:hypothetical protein
MRRDDIEELRLIQERQNHKDAVLASHVAMDQLRISIEKIKCDFRKECIILKNSLDKAELSLKLSKETYVEIHQDQQRQINDLKSASLIHKTKCKELEFDKESLQNQIKYSSKLLENATKEVEVSKKENIESFSSLKYIIDRNKLKSREELNKFQEAILNRPSEYKMLKDYIDGKLQEKQIDHDGIYSNIEFFKGKYRIVDKKIENIYTLIQRLEKKI